MKTVIMCIAKRILKHAREVWKMSRLFDNCVMGTLEAILTKKDLSNLLTKCGQGLPLR